MRFEKLLIVLLIINIGCMKKENLDVNDGPEVAPTEVADALYEVSGGKTLADVNTNEYALFEISYRTYTSPFEPFKLYDKKILSKTDRGNDYLIQERIRNFSVIKENGVRKVVLDSETGQTCTADKARTQESCSPDNSTPPANATNYVNALFKPLFVNTRNLIPQAVVSRFYDLRVSSRVDPAPPLMRDRENCAGVPNCEIKIQTVEFTLVQTSGDQRVRQHYEFDYSMDMPHSANPTRFCVKQNILVEERPVPFVQCENIADAAY